MELCLKTRMIKNFYLATYIYKFDIAFEIKLEVTMEAEKMGELYQQIAEGINEIIPSVGKSHSLCRNTRRFF